MAVTATSRPVARRRTRPSLAARRVGYVVAALVGAAMLYAVNRWPGWDAVPFLTARTEEVLPAVNASLVAGLVVNLLYAGHDPAWFRALGDVVTTSFGLVALTRLWTVFPVAFTGGFDGTVLVRALLVLGIAGSVIGIVTALVRLARAGTSGR